MRERFVFERSYYEATKPLTKKQRHDFYDALMAYVFEDVQPTELNAALIGIIENRLDRDLLSYENYEKRVSPEYKRWKKAVLERDGYKCQHCGEENDLHVHHIKSFSKYPELRYEVSNGITLCKKCHKKEHKSER